MKTAEGARPVVTRWEGVGHAMLQDPLSQTTRNIRRNLVAISSLGIASSMTGVVPTSIAGVELSGAEQSALVWFLICATLYQWISFAIYSWPEMMVYYSNLNNLGYKPKHIGEFPVAYIPAACRNLLDFILPFLLALLSIVFLLWRALPLAKNPNDIAWLGYFARVSLTVSCTLVTFHIFLSMIGKFFKSIKGKNEPINPDKKLSE